MVFKSAALVALLTVASLVAISTASVASDWELAGTSDAEIFDVDTQSIKKVRYPNIQKPISLNPLKYAMITYTEAWVRSSDFKSGKLQSKFLAVFDCNGSTGTLSYLE